MLTTTISGFRQKIKKDLEKGTDDFEVLIINHGKNSTIAVVSLRHTILLSCFCCLLLSQALGQEVQRADGLFYQELAANDFFKLQQEYRLSSKQDSSIVSVCWMLNRDKYCDDLSLQITTQVDFEKLVQATRISITYLDYDFFVYSEYFAVKRINRIILDLEQNGIDTAKIEIHLIHSLIDNAQWSSMKDQYDLDNRRILILKYE